MSKKIASARISEKSSKLLQDLNNSLPFDKVLYREDIEGSRAHAYMLCEQGIISKEDYEQIEGGLYEILGEVESGEFKLDGDDEDIHMAVEGRLTDKIGDAGKRLHTARSRNDQVALDFRLYVQNNTKAIADLLLENISTFVKTAEANAEVILPGMTHLQHAQPINFGYHMMAYASMFKRDYERFMSSYERNNYSPIGCAALAGTPHNISRQITSDKLGFNAPTLNCLDTVSDRDFALEILFNISTMMMHMSRLSEELILWSASEFKWITLSDRHATGSSIMPQKKNPDIPELLRGKTGRVNGNLVSLLTVMKGLPLAYNRDLQEDKAPVFEAFDTVHDCLAVLSGAIASATFNKDQMAAALQAGFLDATEVADWLASRGIPFREAHHVAGKLVHQALQEGKTLSQLPLEAYQAAHDAFDDTVFLALSMETAVERRDVVGGPARGRVAAAIADLRGRLQARRDS